MSEPPARPNVPEPSQSSSSTPDAGQVPTPPTTEAPTTEPSSSGSADGADGTPRPPAAPVTFAADGSMVPYSPPPAHRRRRAFLFGGIGAGVLVLALLVALVGVPVYRRLFVATPTQRVLTALDALAAAPTVHYTGGILADGDGWRTRRLDVRITAHGDAYGSVRRPDGRARVLRTDDELYLRPDKGWELAAEPIAAGYRTGHWLTSTDDDLGLDPAALRPKTLAARLRKGLPAADGAGAADLGRRHRAVPTSARHTAVIDGTAVAAYRLPVGAVAYVTADEPYRLLGVDGTLGSDDRYVALSLTAGDKAAGRTVTHRIGTQAKTMESDRDPAEPARYTVRKDLYGGVCGEYSCTQRLRIQADDGDTKRGGYLIVLFSKDQNARHSIGSCMSRIPSITPNHTVEVSCTNRSKAWHRWMDESGGSPGFWTAAVTVSPGWQGDDGTAMRRLLRIPGLYSGYNAGYFGTLAGPVESLRLIDGLHRRPGWSAAAALGAVQAIQQANALGVFGPMASDKALTLSPDTFEARFKRDYLPYYREAARRVRHGAKHVAVRDWRHGDSSYSADVFDLSARRAVWLGTTGAEHTRVGGVLRVLAARARGQAVPHGFRRELRITIGPRSGAYRMSTAELSRRLRADGVRPSTLSGIDRLVIVSGTGTHTFHRGILG